MCVFGHCVEFNQAYLVILALTLLGVFIDDLSSILLYDVCGSCMVLNIFLIYEHK